MLFRAGSRPDPAEVTRLIDSSALASGSSRSAAAGRAGEHALRAQIPQSALGAAAARCRAVWSRSRPPATAIAGSTGSARPGASCSRRGVEVGRDRVARLMRQAGLEGVRRGRRPRTTTLAEPTAERARDLVQRQFVATAPNQLWVADITYLRTYGGFVYLAFILDVYSRLIVGWQLASHLRTELVLDALEMAAALRQPAGRAGVPHRSRQRSTPRSRTPTASTSSASLRVSASKGDAYDNAMAEAFVGELQDRADPGPPSLPSFEHSRARDALAGSASTTTNGCTKNSATCRQRSTNTRPLRGRRGRPSSPPTRRRPASEQPRPRPMVEST